MPWWMIVLIVLAALFLIGLIPVGVDASFDGKLLVKLKIWFFPVVLIPAKPKKKKPKKAKAGEEKPSEKPEKQKQPLTFEKLLSYANLGKELLGDLREKLVLDYLCVHVRFGGSDPAQQAIAYGRAWAAIGILMPVLEQTFTIRKRDVEPRMVSSEKKTDFDARIVLSITISKAVSLGLHALLGYLKLQDKKKGE